MYNYILKGHVYASCWQSDAAVIILYCNSLHSQNTPHQK